MNNKQEKTCLCCFFFDLCLVCQSNQLFNLIFKNIKKTIFLFAFLFVSLFASANEVESNNIIFDKNETIQTTLISVFDDSENLFFEFCITRTNYWYEGTYQHMDGQYYDHFEVEETTTCYY